MEKEKITDTYICSEVKIEENKIVSFNKKERTCLSYKVYKDGFVGVHYQEGDADDETCYAEAEKNLVLKRPYEFSLETGVRSRDKTEKLVTDKELMDFAEKGLKYLKRKYPQFTFFGSFTQSESIDKMENSLGMDYSSRDGHVTADIGFKHKDSKDIIDGSFAFNSRTFKIRQFYKMADNFLENYEKQVEMPEEAIIQMKYYGLTGKLQGCLDAEALKLGTSLLSGKIGEKVFSEDFSVFHDTSDKLMWMNTFWDGEGVVNKKDHVDFIKNGKILRGYADKKTAKKYKVKCTGSATKNLADIPSNGNAGMTIKQSKKTAKELLNGRLSIMPLQYSGGGFKEKGEYTMPVQKAYLCDGEKLLGILPPFTMSSNMFDMFGKDFIGVSKDTKAFNDKTILFKVKVEKL